MVLCSATFMDIGSVFGAVLSAWAGTFRFSIPVM
jgi:hypothetical protein